MDKHHFQTEVRFIFQKMQERSFIFSSVPCVTRSYPQRIKIDFGWNPHSLVILHVRKATAAFERSQDKQQAHVELNTEMLFSVPQQLGRSLFCIFKSLLCFSSPFFRAQRRGSDGNCLNCIIIYSIQQPHCEIDSVLFVQERQ